MKVLVITNYLGNFGGLGRYSKEVVSAQRSMGLDVDVLSEAKSPLTNYEYPLLRKVFNKKKPEVLKNVLWNIRQTRKFSKPYDIIHAHDGWPYAVYGYFAVLGTNKKLYITGIGTYTIAPLTNSVMGFFLKKAYRKAEMVFCISDYVTNKLRTMVSGVNARTVFMGTTDLPNISEDQVSEYKNKYSIQNHTPIFLTVGDIKHRKGQLDTLKGISLIKDKYPDFLYVMIGTDEDSYYVGKIKEYAKAQNIENNILIISNVYEDQVLSCFYTLADIFLLNSNSEGNHFEGFGLVFLEAAQFGKPVIGSLGCGIESALKDGYNGFLTEQGDPEGIKAKILDILHNKREEFSRNSREFYTHFSWLKTAKSYGDHYLS